MDSDDILIKKTACEIVDLLRNGDVTTSDLLDALESRTSKVDGAINALPTLCFDRARAQAARGVDSGSVVAGLPVPIKDLTEVAGVRTTFGSPIFADLVPQTSDILVETLEGNGAVVYGKSNTPEFGAGANTFNEVFGATLNPWNLSRSAAGSSGGAAASLAAGMAWIAHGSDMGGSLRNPASFCGVCGLRPSPGRVATTRANNIDDSLSAEGPMARNIEDLALMLDAMVGEHPADPRSLPHDGTCYLSAARDGAKPRKAAFSRDLGITPVDPEVAAICEAAAHKFQAAGVIVEEACPDLSAAHDTFHVLRARNFAISKAKLFESHRDLFKPEIVWNFEQGMALTADDIIRAETERAAMFASTVAFFEDYDLLLCPATIVPPYPVEQRYVEECDGHKFDNYVEWLGIVYAITLVCCPALSMPCGFTQENLPVGLQVVGPPRREAKLLAGALQIEQVLDLGAITPIDPRPGV
jgi:amidase